MAKDGISPLVIEEYLAAADERFLPSLRQLHDPKKLAPIVEKWKRDHRPWARQQIVQYLELPFDTAGHEVVVKRLFKHAESKRDDELMARFAAAFDRLVHRVKRKRYRYDWQTRASWQEEYLYSPRNKLVAPKDRSMKMLFGPNAGQTLQFTQPGRGRVLFTYHTRHYLRRRAWRYFRRMGHQRQNDYPTAVAAMLRLYTDADVSTGIDILDRWSFTHACFGDSDVLAFDVSYPKVKDGRSLSELTAAPSFEPLWTDAGAGRLLVSLVAVARSHAVRVWAIQLLRKHHLQHEGRIGIEQLLPLLDHDDADVQHFAAEALERATGLDKLELSVWLAMLRTRNVNALEIIARLMQRHVRGDQLSLDQLVELTSAQPVPVARLGLDYLKQRTITTGEDRESITRLARAQSAGVAGDITTWALSILGSDDHCDVERVSAFFDSLLQPAREAAWRWLTPQSRGWDDTVLWSRLIESPYDDVRFSVVRALEQRSIARFDDAQLAHVWTSVLLNVHRGGR